MPNPNTVLAKGYLVHYMESAMGRPFPGECREEIKSIIDNIVQAAVTETLKILKEEVTIDAPTGNKREELRRVSGHRT